jgi:tRNA acetyltransferase TAN1
VNLKEPKKTILVEVIKGLCCITVVTDYITLKKYNLNELTTKPDSAKEEQSVNAEKEPEENSQDPAETKDPEDENKEEN